MEQIQVKKIWKEDGQTMERVMTLGKDTWERIVRDKPDKNVTWERIGASPAKAKETVLIADNRISTKNLKKTDEVITNLNENKNGSEKTNEPEVDYSKLTEEQIREEAKKKGIRGYQIIKVETLIKSLKQHGNSSSN